MKKLPIDLDELIAQATWSDTMEMGPVVFLDVESGDLVWIERDLWNDIDRGEDVSDYDPNEVEIARQAYEGNVPYQYLPELDSDERFQFMENFVRDETTGEVREKLIQSLRQRKPFRRFKDALLQYPDIRDQWFAYEEERQREWAIVWLKSLGIEPIPRSIVHQGSCLCGAVSFEVKGELPGPDACHCVQCRKHSGHFFVSTDVPKKALTVHGEEHLTWFPSAKKKVKRGFCSTCGSSLFWDPLEHDWIGVAMGAFEQPTGTEIAVHVHVGEKGDYYEITDGLPQKERP
jgi:hypothetical protein